MATTRREFLGAALATGALAVLAPRGAQGSDARISVLINEPVGTISPNLYSHFVEHLGGVVYDGIFVATPNFHVFEMYAAHQGAQAVRTEFVAPRVAYTRTVNNNRERAEFWGLAGSASISSKQLTLTAVNPDAKNARETEIFIPGARIASGQARVLTSSDIHAHNSFANPQALQPQDEQVTVSAGGKLVHRFAPASVTRLQLTLT